MKVRDIFSFIDKKFPFSDAMEYDNPGLLVGDENAEVKKALIALDCTDAAIDTAKSIGANLIITHHPVIYEPLKNVRADSIVYRLIKENLSVISIHTNLDVGAGGVNDQLCERLGLKNVTVLEIDGFKTRMGLLSEPLTAMELANLCQQKIVNQVKFTDTDKMIQKVAVCGGSGGSMLDEVIDSGADAFVTSDIKHSVFIAAKHKNFPLYDCGHFETEDTVIEPLCKLLSDRFKTVKFITFHGSAITRI